MSDVRVNILFLHVNGFTFIKKSDAKLHPSDLPFVQLRLFHDHLDYEFKVDMNY
jgi:hypothetical protein